MMAKKKPMSEEAKARLKARPKAPTLKSLTAVDAHAACDYLLDRYGDDAPGMKPITDEWARIIVWSWWETRVAYLRRVPEEFVGALAGRLQNRPARIWSWSGSSATPKVARCFHREALVEVFRFLMPKKDHLRSVLGCPYYRVNHHWEPIWVD